MQRKRIGIAERNVSWSHPGQGVTRNDDLVSVSLLKGLAMPAFIRYSGLERLSVFSCIKWKKIRISSVPPYTVQELYKRCSALYGSGTAAVRGLCAGGPLKHTTDSF